MSALFGLFLAGCGPKNEAASGGTVTVRLAFFPNVTHGVALVGTGKGLFAQELGRGVRIEEQIFNAGPLEIEALFGNQVDIGYIGPGPALNGYLKSRGKALRIVAGAASGGVGFVARANSGIAGIEGLAGRRVAIPQIGGTQDISLRHAMQEAGLTSQDKGGSVAVLPTANPDTLTLFVKKELDAAWVPEPWVARLIREGGGALLFDERDRWPKKRFATTVVIARTKFLEQHPDIVQKFLKAHVRAVDWIAQNPEEAKAVIGERIRQLVGKPLPEAILAESLSRTDFTYDPLRETILTFADWAEQLGYQREGRDALSGLLDVKLLNAALTERKQEPVS